MPVPMREIRRSNGIGHKGVRVEKTQKGEFGGLKKNLMFITYGITDGHAYMTADLKIRPDHHDAKIGLGIIVGIPLGVKIGVLIENAGAGMALGIASGITLELMIESLLRRWRMHGGR